MQFTDHPADHRTHVHKRDQYCLSMWPPRREPRKAAARWCIAYADAVLHEDTFRAFVLANPDVFPNLSRTLA